MGLPAVILPASESSPMLTPTVVSDGPVLGIDPGMAYIF